MKKLCILILLVTIVGIMPALMQYGCFVLASDMGSQEVPFIIETKRMLMSGHPWWSWNHLIGDNFISCYSFYTLTSPFVWINCLFPDQWMLYGITFTLLLKMLCTGLACYCYLRKMSITTQSSVIGALMYAFSSFAVSNLFYYHFMEPMMVFPLLLIAIERFLKRETYSGVSMVLAAFLVFFINFYFAACSMIAALLYTICRMCSREIHVTPLRTVYGLLLVGLGLLLSSFILLPTVMHIDGNPRQSSYLSLTTTHLFICIERLYTLFEPKLVEGTNTAIAVNHFCSNAANVPVVGLLLAGLFSWRHKGWIGALVAVSVILYLTPLNGVFSLFTNPEYTRWAYALTLFIILASMKFVDEGQPLLMRHFWIYTAICCFGIMISYGYTIYFYYTSYGVLYDPSIVKLNVIIKALFLLQMCLLFAYVKHNTPAMLLKCVVIMSLVYFPVRVMMNTDVANKSIYRTIRYDNIRLYTLDNPLPYHEGNFEWRTDLLALYPNVCFIKNRPSIATFNSIQNKQMSQLLKAIGSRIGVNTARVERNVVSYDALMSVKEIIAYDHYMGWCDTLKTIQHWEEPSREPCLTNKRVAKEYTTYDNRYYIPMGFSYDRYIPQSEIDSLMAADKLADVPLQLLANLAVPDSLVPTASSVMQRGAICHSLSIDSIVAQRRKNVCSRFEGDTRGFTASVSMPRKNLLFFSVVSDQGFTASVDGQPTTIYPVNLGLSAIMVDKGDHKIEFRYFPPGLKQGLLLSLVGVALTLIIFIAERRGRRKGTQPR